MFTNWQRFLFVSINAFVEVAASVTNISCIAQVTLKLINNTLLVNSGWLYFSNFNVFVEFSADEHGLNGGLDFWAEVCETFFHYIRRDLIFEWYDNSDGRCSRVGWWNVLLVCYLGIYKLLNNTLFVLINVNINTTIRRENPLLNQSNSTQHKSNQTKSNVGFWGEGKTGEKPLGADKRTNNLSPLMMPSPRNRTGATLVEGECSTTAPTLRNPGVLSLGPLTLTPHKMAAIFSHALKLWNTNKKHERQSARQ